MDIIECVFIGSIDIIAHQRNAAGCVGVRKIIPGAAARVEKGHALREFEAGGGEADDIEVAGVLPVGGRTEGVGLVSTRFQSFLMVPDSW